MMQLIHSRKLWKQTLSPTCRNTGIPITLEGVYHQRIQYSKSQIRCREQLIAKDHGEEALDGRALEYTMLLMEQLQG
jgi:hypothetical protein